MKRRTRLFRARKILSEQGHHEAAIQELLQALQLSPIYEKAQAYLDFSLQHTSQPVRVLSSVSQQSKASVLFIQEKGTSNVSPEKSSPSAFSKDTYIDITDICTLISCHRTKER